MFLLVCVTLFTGGLCMMSLPVWLPSPMFLWGVSVSGAMSRFAPGSCGKTLCTFWRGSLSRGSLCPGASLSGDPRTWTLPYRRVKSGRYASYWNAFLFISKSDLKQEKNSPTLSRNRMIEFRSLNQMSSVREVHNVFAHEPGAMCSSAAGDVLCYVNANKKLREIRSVRCR